MRRLFSIVIVLLFALGCFFLEAQTLSQAKNWYLQHEFEKALPVFKKLIVLKPKDPSLNLWYGACLIETGNQKNALPYLENAQDKAIPDALYYFAKYYLLIGKTDSALTYINEYLDKPEQKINNKDAALELKSSIEARLTNLRKVEDITFIDSLVVLKSVLYTSLKLSPDAGEMVPARNLFPNSPKAYGSAYLPERNDKALYGDASAGKGLDLFVRYRLMNEWDDEERISDAVNTMSDEINPWLMSDGTTLYFASNKPEGFGGYDLYVTRNVKNDEYLLPDHLNMPFNSPANDYFLVIDEFSNRGYLATDRNQSSGYAVIYTFIPNPTTVLVEGKTLEELQDLAAIKSIKASQKGKNLDSLMQQREKTAPINFEVDSADVFILNDSLNCLGVDDFISSNAMNLFKKYTDDKKRLGKIIEDLNWLRETYLSANEQKKNEFKDEILQLETQMLTLKNSIPSLEIKIRNLELSARTK